MVSRNSEPMDGHATQPQLERLFGDLSIGLVNVGDFDVNEIQPVIGWKNGFPIHERPVMTGHDAGIASEALRRIVPDVLEVLGIEGPICASYTPGYYNARGDSGSGPPTFEYPSVGVVIFNDGVDKSFDVMDTGKSALSERFLGQKAVNAVGVIDIDPELEAYIRIAKSLEGFSLEKELGLDKISSTECDALQRVSDNLEALISASE